MKYLKKFNDHTAYTAYLPNLTYKNTPNIGLCSIEDEVHFTSPIPPHYYPLEILYVNAKGKKRIETEILPTYEEYTPIAICIVETDFFGTDEPARWMSLKYMNCNTPETGALYESGIYWGNTGVNIDTIDDIKYTNNGNEYGWGFIQTSWQTNTLDIVPSSYDSNGDWNTSILGEVNMFAMTDIDGKNKTNKLLATVTNQSNWRVDSTITNSENAGYAPAACCCARYRTMGTESGDWYLGGAGEMAFIIELKNELNTKLSQIHEVYPHDCIMTIDENGLWSSTEFSKDYSYFLLPENGLMYYDDKDYNNSVLAIMQF